MEQKEMPSGETGQSKNLNNSTKFEFNSQKVLECFPIYDTHNETRPAKKISLAGLCQMMQNPTTGPKKQAHAITPYLSHKKTKQAALAGEYYAIVLDHDHDDKDAAGIMAIYDFYNIAYIAFTTSSHMGDGENRWKIIIFLAYPLKHDQWLKIAIGFSLKVSGDQCQARTCQVFYAPNKLSAERPYEHIEKTDKPFLNPNDIEHPFIKTSLKAFAAYEIALEAKATAAKPKPRANDCPIWGTSIIDKVNNSRDIVDVLSNHNYPRIGKKYLSPESESGMPGVTILQGNRCYSHHGTGDPLSNLNHGGHSLDVFDCLCILDYGRDFSRAVRELANIVDPEGQKERQREYMQEKERREKEEEESRQAKEKNIWESPMDIVSLIDIEPAPLEWFAEKRIIAKRGLLITGIGGTSKTRLLYQLAAGAALKFLPWQWQIKTFGRSVLVLTEDTANDVHMIINALSYSLMLSLEEKQKLYQSLIIYPLAGKDTILLNKTSTNTLEKSKLFLDLTAKIKSLGDVVFVGMDPALSLTDGDELDQSNQRALGKMADDLAVLSGATVALVTHATKGSLRDDVLSSHSSRGGGAITDAARTEFVMRRMTIKEYNKTELDDKEEMFRHVQLTATKGNYLPPDAYLPVWLRRDDSGMLFEADISFDKKGQPTERDISALSLLRQLSLSSDRSLNSWRELCIKNRLINSDSEAGQKKAMQRIVKALKDAGRIKPGIGNGIWIANDDDEDDIF